MDGTELDEIMNDAPLAEVVIEPGSEPNPSDAALNRDPATGKFAPKAPEPDQAAQAEIEGHTQEHAPEGTVPQQALHASRQREKEARDQAADLARQLAEMRGQISVLTTQRQEPAKPTEQPKPPSLWESPDEFVAERLAPIQQSLTQQRFETSQMLAEEKYGADVVKAADDALGELIKANDPAVAIVQQEVLKARHPYAALVAWHERHKAMSEIGSNPSAWQTQERERIRAELMAELGVEPSQAQPQTPNAPPSTTKPLTKLPQSLSRLPGSGNSAGASDLSDAGIFSDAMSGR